MTTLLRDRFTRSLLVAAALLWLPYFLPGSPLQPVEGEVNATAYVLQGVMLALGIAACLSGWSQRDPHERQFFGLIALGLSCWAVEQLIEFQIDAEWGQDLRLSLLGDSLYVSLYLCVILAVELRPHSRTHTPAERRLRWLDCGGAALTALGLFAYLVLPVFAYDTASYLRYLHSVGLYSLFDLYLVTRLASLVISTESPRWRATYAWMLAGVSIWFVFDLSEALDMVGVVARPFSARIFDTSWFLTPLLFAAAARVARLTPTVPQPEGQGDFFAELWDGPLLANAVLFPLVHFVVSAWSEARPEVESIRELVAGVATLALLGMAVVAQRDLARENRRLAAERAEVHQRALLAQRLENLGKLAGGVAHDFNNLLQVIRVCADGLLAELEPRSAQRVYAQEILLATERAAALGGRLLSLSREEPARPSTPRPAPSSPTAPSSSSCC